MGSLQNIRKPRQGEECLIIFEEELMFATYKSYFFFVEKNGIVGRMPMINQVKGWIAVRYAKTVILDAMEESKKKQKAEQEGKVYISEALKNSAPKMLETLEGIASTINDSEHWWMASVERGGFDIDSIEETIKEAKR